MAATESRRVRTTWPIVYERRTRAGPTAGTGLAWVLFLGLGLPFVLMTVLTVLARAGIYIELFRPLWQPWPPDLLKPFLGVAVFAATLAYLTYRVGHRRGLRVGAGVALVASRSGMPDRAGPAGAALRPEARPLPPPPPPDILDEPL
jgi:hypothetical protein